MKVEMSHRQQDINNSTNILFLFEKSTINKLNFLQKDTAIKVYSILKENEFKGELGEIYALPKSFIGERSMYLAGLGKENKFNLQQLKYTLGKTIKYVQTKKINKFILIFPQKLFKNNRLKNFIKNIVIISHVASYQFKEYLTDKNSHLTSLQEIKIYHSNKLNIKETQKSLREGQIIGEAINFTRNLGNLPPLIMTPTHMAQVAMNLGQKTKKLKIKILDKKEIKREKMGGIYGVSEGSYEEPKFIVLEWFNAPKSYGTYVCVGKAITFDSGGISIKPAEKMDEMKFDMLGGGAVLGCIKAITELNLKINVVGLIPATENMLSKKAYRPGDILRAKNGKTIEVINTDAEGRIILADALCYANNYKPKFVIDLATLTGACLYALGENYAGIFSRNKKYLTLLKKISDDTGEGLWELPLNDEFKEQVKSKIADVRNLAINRYAGASTGAAFLEYFTSYPWVHIDIAGVAWCDEKVYMNCGATGYGVRLLTELFKRLSL